ncbi:hypothetical protein PTKIN_Ptkin10aG0077900 [Pterospermum kingtungense]
MKDENAEIFREWSPNLRAPNKKFVTNEGEEWLRDADGRMFIGGGNDSEATGGVEVELTLKAKKGKPNIMSRIVKKRKEKSIVIKEKTQLLAVYEGGKDLGLGGSDDRKRKKASPSVASLTPSMEVDSRKCALAS